MAEPGADEYFERGVKSYESRDYEAARDAFEKAVKMAPDNAQYHHMLGKSYGRIAQKSNWLKAMYLAKKTLREFQTAAKLDDQDEQIIRDLIEYYQQAPGFLGGSRKKAESLMKTLAELKRNKEKAS